MDIDFVAHVEQTLDDFKTRIDLLEKALTAVPQINMQPDPSRPQGVVVEPLPIAEAPNG